MALPTVFGTETEYGITVRNQADFNATWASSQVVNAYQGGRVRVQWSFEEETPGKDARGFGYETYGAPDVDTGLVNVVLSNGARFYVDHAHPEYSGPECIDPYQATLYEKAGERIVDRAAAALNNYLPPDEKVYIHKNNSDGKGNSYGYHENYLVARDLAFSDLIRYCTTWMVTRQIFTGSGKIGSENGRPDVDYQITQRADFFEEEVGLETTLKRPIINTRDEPHADGTKYRRFHVIMGDANMSEVQTFIKLGATSLLLSAVEDQAIPDSLQLADPVGAAWRVSHDLHLGLPLELASGGTATALEIQREYFEWLAKYVENELPGPVWSEVISEWGAVLDDLEADPMRAADRLDWVAKLRLVEGYRQRNDLSWRHPRPAMIALQYHDTHPDRGLAYRLENRAHLRRLFTDEQVEVATATPPADTRAFFRGSCVERFGNSLLAANWDSLLFDVGESILRRVPMMEPLKGTQALVGGLLESFPNPADFLNALGEADVARTSTQDD